MRIDKYDPVDGGFRALLNASQAATAGGVGDADAAIGVGLNASGRVVAGAGNTGILGVLVVTRAHVAGDVVDVMTDGEIVEFAGTAGTVYYADTTTGAIGTTGGAGKVRVGHTVEAGRLVVRMDRGADTLATLVVGDQTAIPDLNQTISDPPTQAEVQAISDKVDALLATLRTAGLLAV